MNITYMEDIFLDKFLGKTISEVKLGLVYYFKKSRNAYHSTMSFSWYPRNISTNLDDLKNLAESQRTQGSAFWITGLPVLILAAENLNVFITQMDSPHPLENYKIPGALDEFIDNQKRVLRNRNFEGGYLQVSYFLTDDAHRFDNGLPQLPLPHSTTG